jgi:hypothetical protein
MKKVIKWFFILLAGGLLVYVCFWIYAIANFSFGDGKYYSKQDAIDNYNQRTQQIVDLAVFINKVVPTGKTVDIEFDGNKRVAIFHVVDNGTNDSNWDLKINSAKVDTLLNKLSWTHQTLTTLKEKLDAANCISIKNGDPCNIGFQRSGMGKYYYNLFDKPISDSLRNNYNDSCTYILYSDRLVLEYGGGAVGPQCFPTK